MFEDELKIHMGCGDIYLNGYVNCDLNGSLVSEGASPELNRTTLDQYFDRYPFGTPPRPFIVDKKFNATKLWPFADNIIDEIVTISFIEHFTPRDAQFIMSEVYRVLKPGGRWIVDFPDIARTVEKYLYTDTNFCMRLIYCNQKNDQSIHRWGYTADTFAIVLATLNEWTNIKNKQVVKHDYPMIPMVAIK